jgi:hypothetical protein
MSSALEGISLVEMVRMTALEREPVQWHCVTRLRKFHGDWSAAQIEAGLADHSEYQDRWDEGNILTTVGATDLWNGLIGGTLTVYNHANASIGVGDGNGAVPAVGAGDTDLTATTNKLRVAVDLNFPSVATNAVTFQSTFSTTQANWAWNEWCVANAATGGHILNHRGVALGTKVSTATWQFAVTLSLS